MGDKFDLNFSKNFNPGLPMPCYKLSHMLLTGLKLFGGANFDHGFPDIYYI